MPSSSRCWCSAWVAAAILSTSVAYAVSLPAFTFALPGLLLPSIVFLLLQPRNLLQGWGVLGLTLLVALLVVARRVTEAG